MKLYGLQFPFSAWYPAQEDRSETESNFGNFQPIQAALFRSRDSSERRHVLLLNIPLFVPSSPCALASTRAVRASHEGQVA
ncbi:hypothetical protein MRX96_059807 [Rhipicephalus microplus]